MFILICFSRVLFPYSNKSSSVKPGRISCLPIHKDILHRSNCVCHSSLEPIRRGQVNLYWTVLTGIKTDMHFHNSSTPKRESNGKILRLPVSFNWWNSIPILESLKLPSTLKCVLPIVTLLWWWRHSSCSSNHRASWWPVGATPTRTEIFLQRIKVVTQRNSCTPPTCQEYGGEWLIWHNTVSTPLQTSVNHVWLCNESHRCKLN